MKLFTLSILFIIKVNIAFSCICDRPKPIEEYTKISEEVFIGMPINQECSFKIDNTSGEAYVTNYITTFEVIEKFKGNNNKTLYLSHGSSSCDDHFEIGKGLYLVFANYGGPKNEHKIERLLNSSQCLPNGKIFLRYNWETKTRPKNIKTYENIEVLKNLFPNKIELNEKTETEDQGIDLFFYLSIILTLIIIGIITQKLTKFKQN